MCQKNDRTRHVKRQSHFGQCSPLLIFSLVLIATSGLSFAQVAAADQNQSAPLTITLQDALQRARQNDPQYRSVITDLGVAREDRVQARAGLLPNVSYNNSFIYTQGTGPQPNCSGSATCTGGRFV